MPDSCCAVGCTNRRVKKQQNDGNTGQPQLHFYKIPASGRSVFKKEKRRLWLQAIRRENWSDEEIKHARLCSAHFISGKTSDDRSDPDFVPSIFEFLRPNQEYGDQKKKRFERYKRRSDVVSTAIGPEEDDNTKEVADILVEMHHIHEQINDNCDANDEAEVAEMPFEMHHVQEEFDNCDGANDAEPNQCRCRELERQNAALQMEADNLRAELRTVKAKNDVLKQKNKDAQFGYDQIKDDHGTFKFYTGLPSTAVFMWLLLLCQRVMKFKRVKNTAFGWSDQMLMILMKLRLGLKDKDIAYRFGINRTIVSRIMRTWIPKMAIALKPLIKWPSTLAARQHLPKCFKKKFKRCIAVIDCTEIFIERATNLTARSQTWSSYKHNNTIKYFVAITPSGSISFMSKGWGGRVSDKEITVKSGFLDKLDYGDEVLADRGFNIKEELAIKGGRLRVPTFTKGKKQLSKSEVDTSRQLSRARIHVERVIGRLKSFRILQTTLPITQVDMLDDIVNICAGLVNLNKSVVPLAK